MKEKSNLFIHSQTQILRLTKTLVLILLYAEGGVIGIYSKIETDYSRSRSGDTQLMLGLAHRFLK